MEHVHRHIDEHFKDYLSAVGDLVRQPSISATGEGVRECARLLADMMTSAGIRTEILETGGNPVVYGEIPSGRKDGKTVLFLSSKKIIKNSDDFFSIFERHAS